MMEPNTRYSTLRFFRFGFEPNILIPQIESPMEKIKREINLFRPIINYDFDIQSHLKKAEDAHIQESKLKRKKNQRIHPKIESLDEQFNWKFGDVDIGIDYIYGRLAKIRKTAHIKTDDIKKGFKETQIEDVHIANFLIDFTNHIFVLEAKRDIGYRAPCNLLKDLINSYYVNDTNDRIFFNTMTNRKKIIDTIMNYEKITYLKLSVRKSNPHSSEIAEIFDKFLDESKVNNAEIVLRSSKGMDIKAHNFFILSGLSLAEEGYGKITVKNEKVIDEKIITEEINSYKYPIIKKTKMPNKSDNKISHLKSKIDEVLQSIFDEKSKNKK